MLTDLKAAGAADVILGWTDISDENAADQYVPFGRAHQDLRYSPILSTWVAADRRNTLETRRP